MARLSEKEYAEVLYSSRLIEAYAPGSYLVPYQALLDAHERAEAAEAQLAAWREAMTDLFGDAGPPGREDEGWWLHEDAEESAITPAEAVRQLTQLWRGVSELAERLTRHPLLGPALARVGELVALDPPADTPAGRELVLLSDAVAAAEAAEARVRELEAKYEQLCDNWRAANGFLRVTPSEARPDA